MSIEAGSGGRFSVTAAMRKRLRPTYINNHFGMCSYVVMRYCIYMICEYDYFDVMKLCKVRPNGILQIFCQRGYEGIQTFG